MTDLASVHATVHGYVQGVFYRAFVADTAMMLLLTGYVRNLPNGDTVEVEAEGERKQLEKLVGFLREGPPAARVEQVTTVWQEYTGKYSGFSILY